jgi:drug/metabolite transporter (DMT)-like permease
MGVLNNVIPFTLIVWGQVHVASGVAAILNATTPLFGVVVAHFSTRDERMTPLKLVGVVIGIAGVAAMVGGAAVRELGSGVAGQLAILAAALSYAVAGVFGRRFGQMGISPIQVAAGQTTGSGAVLLPLSLATSGLPAAGSGPWAAVIGLALLCTAFAYILYFRILAVSGAVNLLLVTLLVPVSAILLGAAFLGETVEPRHLVGMAAIALGLACIDGRPLGWLRRARA